MPMSDSDTSRPLLDPEHKSTEFEYAHRSFKLRSLLVTVGLAVMIVAATGTRMESRALFAVGADAAEQFQDQGNEPAPGVVHDSIQPHAAPHRPADEIVKEIETYRQIARRQLEGEEWIQAHTKIVTLVADLRRMYPDDVRVATFLPDRWLSLKLIDGVDRRVNLDHSDRMAELNAEIGEVLNTTEDSSLQRSASFFQIVLRLQKPIDGPVAAALAETFARQWPDDNRAGELFYNAAMKLDRAWSIRIGLVVLMVVIGALVAATSRNRPPRPRRRWMLTVVLGLLGVAILAAVLVTWGGPGTRQMAITSMLVQMVFENVRSVVWTSRTAVVVALSVAAALTLVVVRRRYFGTFMQRVSAVRLWVIGFSTALAVCCAMDAILVSHKRTELARRIVDEYPDSFRGRMVRGQERQRERIGQPFELEFTDAISGRTVSMKQFRGKIVVVDFWATSCGPCRREIPELKRLYAQYHDQGVEFIGVSQDGPEEDGGFAELKSFVAKEQIPWPQFYEGHDSSALLTGSAVNDFSESWGIDGIPTVFLIDADGNLYSTEAQGKLDTLISKLLKMPNTSAL